MFKTALLDCAINGEFCSVDGGRGICLRFSPHPGGFDQRICHPRQKKVLMPGGQPGGGGRGRWAQLELTDALQRRLPVNWVWIRDILIEFTERFFSGYATSSSLNFFVKNNLKC